MILLNGETRGSRHIWQQADASDVSATVRRIIVIERNTHELEDKYDWSSVLVPGGSISAMTTLLLVVHVVTIVLELLHYCGVI